MKLSFSILNPTYFQKYTKHYIIENTLCVYASKQLMDLIESMTFHRFDKDLKLFDMQGNPIDHVLQKIKFINAVEFHIPLIGMSKFETEWERAMILFLKTIDKDTMIIITKSVNLPI